tara:strand:- start:483 stop:773 length:291 start_codon:yes stop_codon:yes gene_type:complete
MFLRLTIFLTLIFVQTHSLAKVCKPPIVKSEIQLKENLKICDKGDKLLLIYDIKLNTEDLIVNLCSLKDIIISKEEINIIHKRGSGLSIICTYDPN